MPEAPHHNISVFFVPIEADGVEVIEPYKDSGRMAISTGGFVLKDVRLPDEYRLGEVGKDFYHNMEGFDNARLMMGASCAGVIRRILDDAIPYIKERKVLECPCKNEAIQFEPAEICMEMGALRLMTISHG